MKKKKIQEFTEGFNESLKTARIAKLTCQNSITELLEIHDKETRV